MKVGELLRVVLSFGVLVIGASLGLSAEPAAKQAPLALDPHNPHYFFFRGKPVVLVGSGEHYGSVLNLSFDYVRYLDALAADGLNHTRLFSGTYHEPQGAFGIVENTLAPRPDRYLCPWKRSTTPGAKDGGNKFDLGQFDAAFFARLERFLAAASKRNIVVEVNLFSPNYDDSIWAINPMNTANNISGIGAVAANQTYTLDHPDLLRVQDAVVREIVAHCREFDNLYFEVCNEPYFGGVTSQWQDHIVQTIRDAERSLPVRHLISMNYANGSKKIEHPNPAVSIFNFHYCDPPNAVAENRDLPCVIGENETGFKGSGDDVYRMEAWDFILAGGGLYDNLDYSFTVSNPDGSRTGYKAPGGGSAKLRRQLRVLHEFIEGFNFIRMKPDDSIIKSALSKGAQVHALAEAGEQYAVYMRGGKVVELSLDLPAGNYDAHWVDPESGQVTDPGVPIAGGGITTLRPPSYVNDIALRLIRRRK